MVVVGVAVVVVVVVGVAVAVVVGVGVVVVVGVAVAVEIGIAVEAASPMTEDLELKLNGQWRKVLVSKASTGVSRLIFDPPLTAEELKELFLERAPELLDHIERNSPT